MTRTSNLQLDEALNRFASNQLGKLLLAKNFYPQLLRFGQLASGVFTRHEIIGFFGYTAGSTPAQLLDQFSNFIAFELTQGACDDGAFCRPTADYSDRRPVKV